MEGIKPQTSKKRVKRVERCEQGTYSLMGKRCLCPQNILETLIAVLQTTKGRLVGIDTSLNLPDTCRFFQGLLPEESSSLLMAIYSSLHTPTLQ